ncbi:hypothetical protein GW17_00036602 [Ensete ventricosum]|nr:hypothetical protein GW17_00036602 [Ensete ventricosum]
MGRYFWWQRYQHRCRRFGFSPPKPEPQRYQMAALLASSLPSFSSAAPQKSNRPHRLLSNTLALASLSCFSTAIKSHRSSSFAVYSAVPGEGREPRITDEWGEKFEPEAEPQSAPDPPRDEDEWGTEPGAAASFAAGITDEWGEKAEPEVETPAPADPPVDEDEWGREPGAVGNLSGNGTPSLSEDNLRDLKRCLVDSLYGTELGFRASVEDRADILELVNQLEAANPTPAPTEAPELLDGNWILLIQVQFKEGTFQPPEISSTLDLPEKFDIFGQSINLKPFQQTLNPVQEAVANVTGSISGQPPLKLPLPGNRAESWLLITYLDKDFRISRGDGGLFVLAKEGSPLLDQLS